MFLDFYQMREQPFGVTPDPRFLYLGQSHREALASLFCAIEADCGFVALIAHPGLGKTTLTFQLLEKLQRTSRTVFLFQTQCSSRELFHYVLNDLGVDASGMDIVSMHNKLNEILSQERLAGRRFVLAIDEAQNLNPSVLETIRLLSNFETSRAKLLQILLIGQPQLARKLASPTLVQLQQRISVFARLQPFGSEDTARYIAHRLKVAGYGGDPLFTPGALRIITDRSQGIPRNINSLCFSALSLGCAVGRKRIDAEIVREVVADLDLESLNQPVLTHRATRAPVTAGPVLSYRTKSKSRLRRWALGATSVAVSIAVVGVFFVAGVFLSSPGRIGRFWQAKTEASATVYNSSASAESSSEATSVSRPIASLSANAGEIPAVTPLQSSLPGNDSRTIDVVVQSGETLYSIARQTLGQDSGKLIEQIRNLNPAVTDPDHIEAGQEIRMPRLSKPVKPPTAGGANDMSGKTGVGRGPK
jgi:type II secretory pathway predicted ATPase ExeA